MGCLLDDIDPNSILGYFQHGRGIQALCDIAVVTATNVPAAMSTAAQQTAAQTNVQSNVNGPKSTIFISAVSVPSTMSKLPSSTATSTATTVPMTLTPSQTSSSSSATTVSAQEAQATGNPSNPKCNGKQSQGNSGSPFDSFTDQLCSGAPSLLSRSSWVSILGTVAAVLMFG
jgi:hypothetical protein